MSVPSHCSLMRPAAARLSDRLAQMDLRPPRVGVINNADVVAEQAPERIRSALVRQLYSPVRWVESVTALARAGVEDVVECGPGGVLTTLCKRIAPDLKVSAPKDAAGLQELALKTSR
jgi:[acyl-carrier-protein] S-malonyltransferase